MIYGPDVESKYIEPVTVKFALVVEFPTDVFPANAIAVLPVSDGVKVIEYPSKFNPIGFVEVPD